MIRKQIICIANSAFDKTDRLQSRDVMETRKRHDKQNTLHTHCL